MSFKSLLHNNFLRQIAQTILTRFSVQLISIIGSIFIIRELGVYERGQFAFAASVIAIGIQFANLGFHSVNTIHLSKTPDLLHKILANNFLIILFGTIIFSIFFLIIHFLYYSSNVDAIPSITIALLCVPIGLVSLFNQNILIALGKIKEFNVSELAQKFSFVIIAVPIAFYFKSAEAVLWCSFFSFLITYVYTKKIFQNKISQLKKNIDLALIKQSTGVAARLYIVCLLMFLILKIDIWMIESMLGTKATGIYSVASSLTDSLLIIPSIVGQLIFPRFVKNTEGGKQELIQTVALILAFMIPICIFVFIFSADIVTLIFGKQFIESALSLKWLTLAVSFLGANTIFMNFLSAKKVPFFVFFSLVFSCLLNITLNYFFLRSIGIHGAARSSLISYFLIFVLNGFYILFFSNRDKKEPTIEDHNSLCASTNCQ